MIPKALRSFILRVQSETESNALSWDEADGLAYFCDHKNHTLHISSHFDDDRGVSSFHFRIVTGGKSTPFTVRDDEDDYDIMRNLFEAVIANANDVDDDIADFFD
ncbi:TPA: hypothetical protein QDB11_005124 [Burkholderia vietnamiensis]|uniref:hypothetical protein n=1 Tax=Burkholderia vietnamiensis TaxID=60552 RepID=UPI00075784D3|nr:hypothetical protein [Burkholderia vietnamiensis]KVF40412.1 hypothetical protein WJ09_24840 [Burkholderia vietnamiensis]MDN8115407.1 hypothetical protein [Burkholderia vietnamiensis]HDR9140405.1 hypothetical protein [Burkholderia vietnamiensis]